MMHPGGLLSPREADVCVGQGELMYCAGSKEKQAIVIGAVETMGTQHSSASNMVCTDADVDVTKDNQLARLWHRRQECVYVLVEFAACGIRAGHQRSADADDGNEFTSPERQAEAHQTVVNAPR
nr:unnamed protein product [Spirometra erinaceieuropaei]